MTKEQSVLFMNILAELLCFIQKFSLPFQAIHALINFECIGEKIRGEMDTIIHQSSDLDVFLKLLREKSQNIASKENQNNMLSAYHMCIWMDRRLTYEDVSEKDSKGKLSIYEMIPMRAFSYNEIDALNDNYKEVGIWINPKLPIFRSALSLSNGEEKKRTTASRDVFTKMNGEFHNICYFEWKGNYVIHNIIIPYEYEENRIENNADGHLRVGFIPVSDKKDLIIPQYKEGMEGEYKLKKMYVDRPNHQEEISTRLKNGLELACTNDIDIVFAPEMLGTEQTEQISGNYNVYIHDIYGRMVMNGKKPPFVTIMPSYWYKGINSATIVYRDGRVIGRQKKYTPYIDFKSCSIEGIHREEKKEIYLLHVYGVHRIAISICAEFIDSFDCDLICGQLGATLIIVPSFSHGERDFINSLGTLFPFGTSVIWGDCCGAVTYSPKIIGGCSLVGLNKIYRMGDYCQCSYSCAGCSACLFTIDLPLKIVMSKNAQPLYESIQHILL